MLSCFFPLLVWCGLLPSLAMAQSTPASKMVILSASGDGTCVNNGTVAVNCSMPFTLALRVQHLIFPLNPYVYIYPDPSGSLAGSFRLSSSGSNGTSANDSLVLFTIAYDPFEVPADVLFSYYIKDWSNAAADSAPAPLFSLMAYPRPLVTGVTGCRTPLSANPLLTTDCIADVDTLTVTGSGFEPLTSFGVVRTVGNVTETIRSYTAVAGWNAVVYNDSVMALALTDVTFLFLEEHYAGQLISLTLYWPSNYTSDPFQITLAPVPAPQVTTSYSWPSRSVLINNRTVYAGCIPQITTITISGRFLINLTITVGGVEAARQDSSLNVPAYDAFRLPLITPYNSTALYDVVISNYGGTVVLPSAVQYINTPTLTSVAPCYADIGSVSPYDTPLHCKVGDTLRLSGGLFTQANRTIAAINIVDSAGWQPLLLPPCLSPTIVSDSLITCTLPAYADPDVVGTYLFVTVTFTDGNSTNQLGIGYVYDQPRAPRVLAVKGCASGIGGATQISNVTTGLVLRGCELGDVITLYGTGFYRLPNESWTGVSGTRWYDSTLRPTFSCFSITVLSNTSVTCALPIADEWSDMQPLTNYSLVLYDPADYFNLYVVTSNAFVVSFGSEGQPDTLDTSTSSNVALVASLATVLSVLAVVGVAIAVFCMMRRRAGQQESVVSEVGRGMAWAQDEVRSTRFFDDTWKAPSKRGRDGVELSHK